MWSILLVEDEVFVRRKLKETMDWQAMGFAVAGEAGNGAEAMELIRKLRPDVVISDILMPLMNGVELLKQARQEGYDCRFIMLTVMSDFPYVQQALEYGASSYMLKLYMDPSTLAEAMDKVAKELVLRQRSNARETEDLYRSVWLELTDGTSSELPAKTTSAALPAFFGANGCRLLVISVLHGCKELTLDEFLSWELVDSERTPLWHAWGGEGLTTFFCWVPEGERAVLQRKRYVPHGVVYSDWTEPDGLKAAWAKVLAKVEELWYRPAAGLFPCATASLIRQPPAETWGQEHEVVHNLEQLRWNAVQAAVDSLWRMLKDHRVTMHDGSEIANRINRLCARLSMPAAPESQPLLAASHEQLGRTLLIRLEEHYRYLASVKIAKTDHPEVNKVISYLHDRYEQEITLQELARLVCMDDKYLSGLFKKKTGTSIIQYLHHIRIEQAKRLLRETDLGIAEIGERVGFANDNYFIKIFKRVTSLTPAGFRHQA